MAITTDTKYIKDIEQLGVVFKFPQDRYPPININIYTNPMIYKNHSQENFKFLFCDCLLTNYNMLRANFLALETVRNKVNILDIFISLLKDKALLSLECLKNVNNLNIAELFINSYNQYSELAMKIRKIINNIKDCFDICDRDITYVISNYIYYKTVFDINIMSVPAYKYLINHLNNFNEENVINILQILNHYTNFVKYAPDNIFEFTNISFDFNKFNFDRVINKINKDITENIEKFIKTKEINLISNTIKNIKIYTNLDQINIKFCEKYIEEVFQRCIKNQTNTRIENELVKAFDIKTDIKYFVEIKKIINNSINSELFMKYVHDYKSTINIVSEKYKDKNIQIPELANINSIILTTEENILSNELTPEISIYLDIVKKLYDNYTNNSKVLNFNLDKSTVEFTIKFNKDYNFIASVNQLDVINYITSNSSSYDDIISKYNNKDFIDFLLDIKLIKYYEKVISDKITFTIEELQELIKNGSNLVHTLNELVSSQIIKTNLIVINNQFSSNNMNINLNKLFEERLYLKELINYQSLSTDLDTELEKPVKPVNNCNIDSFKLPIDKILEQIKIDNEDSEIITEEIIEEDEDCEYNDDDEIIEIIEEVYEEDE